VAGCDLQTAALRRSLSVIGTPIACFLSVSALGRLKFILASRREAWHNLAIVVSGPRQNRVVNSSECCVVASVFCAEFFKL